MRQVLAVMAVQPATPEHLVTRATPEITVLLEMAELGVTPVIPEIQVAPEMRVVEALADQEERGVHTLQVLAAPGAQVVQVVALVTPELQVMQVQVQLLAHQVIPAELALLVQRATLGQVEAVLLPATPEILVEQEQLVARAT